MGIIAFKLLQCLCIPGLCKPGTLKEGDALLLALFVVNGSAESEVCSFFMFLLCFELLFVGLCLDVESLHRRPFGARRRNLDGFGRCVVEEVDEVSLVAAFGRGKTITSRVVKGLDLVALLCHGGSQIGVARVDPQNCTVLASWAARTSSMVALRCNACCCCRHKVRTSLSVSARRCVV